MAGRRMLPMNRTRAPARSRAASAPAAQTGYTWATIAQDGARCLRLRCAITGEFDLKLHYTLIGTLPALSIIAHRIITVDAALNPQPAPPHPTPTSSVAMTPAPGIIIDPRLTRVVTQIRHVDDDSGRLLWSVGPLQSD